MKPYHRGGVLLVRAGAIAGLVVVLGLHAGPAGGQTAGLPLVGEAIFNWSGCSSPMVLVLSCPGARSAAPRPIISLVKRNCRVQPSWCAIDRAGRFAVGQRRALRAADLPAIHTYRLDLARSYCNLGHAPYARAT